MKAKNAAFDLVADIGTAMVFLSDKSKEGMFLINKSYLYLIISLIWNNIRGRLQRTWNSKFGRYNL